MAFWKVAPIAVIAVIVQRRICSNSEREWRRREGWACVHALCILCFLAQSSTSGNAGRRPTGGASVRYDLEAIPAFHMGTLEAVKPLTPVTFHPARITDRLLSVSRPHALKPPNGGWLEPLFNGELANVSFFLACESLNSGDKLKVNCLSHPHRHRHRHLGETAAVEGNCKYGPSQNFNVLCATMSYQSARHISSITHSQRRLAVPLLFSARSIDPQRHLAWDGNTYLYA